MDKRKSVEMEIKNVLTVARKMDEESRIEFFEMLAIASIQYMRGSVEKVVLDGFLHAAGKDTDIIKFKQTKITKADDRQASTVNVLLSENKEIKRPLFHGGCHGCTQELFMCPGCRYMAADWSLPNLNHENRKK